MKTWRDVGIDLDDGFEGERVALCPQCSHKRKKNKVKCLSANGTSFVWNCNHCEWSGSLRTGEYSKSNPNAYSKPKAYIKPEYKAETNLPDKVIKFFQDRGITKEILLNNKIGYGEVYMPQVENNVTAIQFPYYQNGEIVNIKYRDGKKNFRMATGARRIFYNVDGISKDDKTLICVEGELDCLSVQEAGIKNVVSVPDGAPSENAKNTDRKFEFLETSEAFLKRFETFIIAVDNDAPGKKLEDELSRRLGIEKCKLVVWPDGSKDANDVLVKHGKERLVECIKKAKDFPISGLFEANDFRDEILDLCDNGYEKGISTGWRTVDEYYTVRPGEFTLIGGSPNNGKTSWLTALFVNLAKKDWVLAIYSPEQKPLRRCIAPFIEVETGLSFELNSKNKITREWLNEYCIDWASHFFKLIAPPENSKQTLDEILKLANSAVLKHGIKGLCIDPWNMMEHERPKGMTETEYISSSLTKIGNFARSKNVHVWVVVHPTKLQKDAEGRYKPPTAYDLIGSSNWFNKAYNILTIHRDKKGQTDDDYRTQIHIQKIKFKEIGKLGVVELKFNRDTGRYTEVFDGF